MVASHTAVPMGTAKWLDRADPIPETLLLGKGQGLLMSPTQGQAYIIGGNPIPAISKNLKAFLYGWLPLSDAQRHPFLANRPLYAARRHLFFAIYPCLIPNGVSVCGN